MLNPPVLGVGTRVSSGVKGTWVFQVFNANKIKHMKLQFIKSGVSKENNFAWVLAALRKYDRQGWLIEDQLIIAQRQGLEPLTESDLDSVPKKAWKPVNKEEA